MLILSQNLVRLATHRVYKQKADACQQGRLKLIGNQHLTGQDLTGYLSDIQAQDETAFDQFYEQTVNAVYGLALRITIIPEAAEEVVSDVYLQVWQQADQYNKEKGSIMTWLLTLCRSRAIDHCRKQQKRRLEVGDSQLSETISVIASPEYLLVNTEQHSLINQALQKLSSVQRQLLSLAFFRGLTYQEIADAIDMPLATVKSHIRRSLIELKAEASLAFSYATDGEEYHG